MPSLREEEPRRRKKDYDRDTSSCTSRGDKERHRSSKKSHRRRSSTSREGSPDRQEGSSNSDLAAAAKPAKKVTMLVPEMDRRSSTGTRSTSYPTFSKEHSKEAVHSREEDVKPKTPVPPNDAPKPRSSSDGPTPEASRPEANQPAPSRTPPSPPLTEEEIEAKRASMASDRKRTTDKLKAESRRTRKSSSDSLRPTSSGSHKTSSHRHRPSPDDSEASDMSERSRNKSKRSDSTGISKRSYAVRETSSDEQAYPATSSITQHTQDSQATEKRSERRPPGLTTTDTYSPSSQPSPRTPISVQHPVQASMSGIKPSQDYYDIPPPPPASMPPPPIPNTMPPPPPPIVPPEANPRVDYLLENGGLARPIPRTFLPRVVAQPAQPYNAYASPRLNQGSAPNDLVQLFAPVHSRLEEYMKVIEKNGSIAVATGYRSVARRLLDRVATVFAREISNERCRCVMCTSRPAPEMSDEEEKGISWGEILEFTVGRRELPQWPPFTISAQAGGLGIVGTEPMQKVDPDVPPEWRDHYLRQNAKTKRAVEGWLSTSDDSPTSAPAEVDDETLTFAITTHIQPERRPLFIALKRGLSKLPPPGVEPPPGHRNDTLAKVSIALQRLYHLPNPPREAECCLYLLNNQYLHNTLATIAAVTDGEWDILVSGRFDGFLVSGAETQMPSSAYGSGINMSHVPSRGPTATPLSRGTTPFSANGRGSTPFSPLRNVTTPDWTGMFPSRGATPSLGMSATGPAAPAPVQVDEETEICVLAETEREILRGMEDLEDQFEKLHYYAEAVRERLRARAAGLAMTAKARRGSLVSEPGVRLGTPGSMLDPAYAAGGWTPDYLNDGMSIFDDGRSELAPDDSASQIGGSRKHRRDGRSSRANRTPAAVAEEDEGADAGANAGGERKSGSLRRRR